MTCMRVVYEETIIPYRDLPLAEERKTSSFPVTSHAEQQSNTGTTGQKKGQSIRGITTIIEKQDYTLHLLSVLLCLWC